MNADAADRPPTSTLARAASRLVHWLTGEAAFATVVALCALASTWSAYQSSRWSGVQARNFASAGTLNTEAAQLTSIISTRVAVDAGLFTEWLVADRADDTVLKQTLEARFPVQLKTAFAAWEAAGGLDSPGAPPSPFVMPDYVVPEAAAANALVAVAAESFDAAVTANRRSDNYVLMTVVFALLIVVSTVGSRLKVALQRGAAVAAAAGLVAGCGVLATFPVY